MDYIRWIRKKVGHDKIILNFSVACITNSQGQILLQKRSKDEELWGFPGGAIEIGESAEEAMLREVKEETGLNVCVDYFIGVYSKYFASYSNGDHAQPISFFFKCTMQGGEFFIDNKETFDLKFFDKEKLPELFCQQHEDMLNDYLNEIRCVCR